MRDDVPESGLQIWKNMRADVEDSARPPHNPKHLMLGKLLTSSSHPVLGNIESIRTADRPQLVHLVADLLGVVRKQLDLMRELQEIQDGPEAPNDRNRAIKHLLEEYGLLGPRETASTTDGLDWLLLTSLGAESGDAIRRVAEQNGRSYEAVRRNLKRFFPERLGIHPPAPLPRDRT